MWKTHFIPNETDHIDVTIDGKFWHTWRSADGDVTLNHAVSPYNQKIHYLAVGQEGKNASLEVLWDGDVRQRMDFDGADGENHDIDH